jgi:hypothetical protein
VCADKESAATAAAATTVITTATATVMAATRMFYRPTMVAAALAATIWRGAVDPGDSGVDMDGVEEGADPDGSDWDEIPAPALLFGMHARTCEVSALAGSSCVKPKWCAGVASTGAPCVPSVVVPLNGYLAPLGGVSQQHSAATDYHGLINGDGRRQGQQARLDARCQHWCSFILLFFQ